MHELALMGDILNLVSEDAEKQNISKVNRIELIVGELSNALPDALMMAFDMHKNQGVDFLDSNAELIITYEKAKAKCALCGFEYHPEYHISVCPECNMPGGKLIEGQTFKVNSYDGE